MEGTAPATLRGAGHGLCPGDGADLTLPRGGGLGDGRGGAPGEALRDGGLSPDSLPCCTGPWGEAVVPPGTGCLRAVY